MRNTCRDKGRDVRCIDTDPVNRTFAQYGALAADRLNLRDEHNRIEQRAFDSLMERFLTEEAATFVVDNGASTFLPLWHYLLENNALDYLRQNGRRVYVHTVITGGQALLDTLNGFHELAQTTRGAEHRRLGERIFRSSRGGGEEVLGDGGVSRELGEGLRRGRYSRSEIRIPSAATSKR